MNKFIATGDYVERLVIHPITSLDDHFHLLITEQLRTAKNPDEQRKKYDATLSREQLTKLRDIIDIHLLEMT